MCVVVHLGDDTDQSGGPRVIRHLGFEYKIGVPVEVDDVQHMKAVQILNGNRFFWVTEFSLETVRRCLE